MATHKTGYPTIGMVWAAALDLWVQYATGSFTTWAYTITTLSVYKAVKVTVGLTGGGTDDYYLGALDTLSDEYAMVRQVFTSNGWRTLPQVVIPATLPNGDDAETGFLGGPFALRQDLVVGFTNANNGNTRDITKNGPDGVSYFVCEQLVWKYNVVFVDVIGMMYGTLSGVDAFAALPTDFEGESPIVAVGGGGGSVDLDPLVAAVNRVALIDVTYTFNNGGAAFSMRGMVAAE